MSIKKDIYLALSSYLKSTIVETDNLPALQWVDKDMGQINMLDEGIILPLPAILIGFGRTAWETLNPKLQQGQSTIVFKVIMENYADSFDGSLDQDLAIKFFDFNEAVYTALQGVEGDAFTPLMRVADEEDEDHANFIVTVMEFATVITDQAAVKKTKLVDAEINTKVKRVKVLTGEAIKAKSDFIIE